MKALHAIDFYKAGHIYQYPENTTMVFSNLTARSFNHLSLSSATTEFFNGKAVFFGLQGFVKTYLIDLWNNTFFNQKKEDVVEDYMKVMDAVLGKGRVTPEHVEALHDLGYLPIAIKSVPEGTGVPKQVPMMVMYNTHPDFFWITNYIETVLSSEIWFMITNATIARIYRKICDKYADLTCDSSAHVTYQCHDFSFRGLPGFAVAGASGTAHLLSFQGTDSMAAIDYARDYYAGDLANLGFAVAATEHAVMCMGTKDGEIETYRRLINEIYPTGIVSIVSDTWDFWKIMTVGLAELKDDILSRDGKTVFRPDSGNPVDILCGYPTINVDTDFLEDGDSIIDDAHDIISTRLGHEPSHFLLKTNTNMYVVGYQPYGFASSDFSFKLIKELTPEMKGAVQCLYEVFGGHINSKGYIELCEKVGLLYGDSITHDRAIQIFERLKDKGFASNSALLGVGSYTYQYNTRDTLGMAVKATAGIVDGVPREIFKDPITDSGTKKSAKGFLRVVKDIHDELILEDQVSMDNAISDEGNELELVFLNSKLIVETSIDEIRLRV